MKERLQKLISAAGFCSRRKAEEWIAEGKVTVNGALARLGDTADPSADEILVQGVPLKAPPLKCTTILLYKPRGYVTTLSDEKGRPTVADLLPPELPRLYPVGRLDRFSEGLLLMTDDGALANRLTHPKGEVNKSYQLWVSGWHGNALDLLRRPIVLDGYRIKPPQVRLIWTREGAEIRDQGSGIKDQESESAAQSRPPGGKMPPTGADEGTPRDRLPPRRADAGTPQLQSGSDKRATALLEITIHEGRNRQIRRMAEAAGLTTTRLKRVAEGPLTLGELKPGQWRELTEAELRHLKTSL